MNNTIIGGKPRRSFREWWRALNEPGDAWLDRRFPRAGRANRLFNRHEWIIAVAVLFLVAGVVFLMPIIAPKIAAILVRLKG